MPNVFSEDSASTQPIVVNIFAADLFISCPQVLWFYREEWVDANKQTFDKRGKNNENKCIRKEQKPGFKQNAQGYNNTRKEKGTLFFKH